MSEANQADLAATLGISLEELASKLPCYIAQCNGHFVLRHNRTNHNPFFGCSNWPRCTAVRRYDEVHEELTCTVIGECGDPDEPFFGM